MLKEVENYLLILNDLRNQVKNLLEKFPDEALDWRPIEGEGDLATNSATILVTHLAGSESFWIKEVIGGQPIHRNRDAEFITKGGAMAELKRRLEGGAQNTEAILSSLTSAELEESRSVRIARGQSAGVSYMSLSILLRTLDTFNLPINYGWLSPGDDQIVVTFKFFPLIVDFKPKS